MAHETASLIVLVVFWGLIGVWILGRHRRKGQEEKERAEASAKSRARHEAGEPMNAIENLEMRLRGARAVHVRGDIWSLTGNRIVADNILDEELGRFPERTAHNVDQETRDTLLVNARRDAAEALLNTQALIREIHAMKSSQRDFQNQIVFLGLIVATIYWYKLGMPLPEWLKGLGTSR
jgi:hypothetical protein